MMNDIPSLILGLSLLFTAPVGALSCYLFNKYKEEDNYKALLPLYFAGCLIVGAFPVLGIDALFELNFPLVECYAAFLLPTILGIAGGFAVAGAMDADSLPCVPFPPFGVDMQDDRECPGDESKPQAYIESVTVVDSELLEVGEGS